MQTLIHSHSRVNPNGEKPRALFAWSPQAYWGKKLWAYCRQNQENSSIFCDNFEIKHDPDMADAAFFKRKSQDVCALIYMWEYSVREDDLKQMRAFLKKAKKSGIKRVVLISHKGASLYGCSKSHQKAYDLEMEFVNCMFSELLVLRIGVILPDWSELKKTNQTNGVETSLGQFYSSDMEPISHALSVLAAIPFVLAVPFASKKLDLLQEDQFYNYVNGKIRSLLESSDKTHKEQNQDFMIPKVLILEQEEKSHETQTLEQTLKKIGVSTHRHGLRVTIRNQYAEFFLNLLGFFFKNIKQSLVLLQEAFRVLPTPYTSYLK